MNKKHLALSVLSLSLLQACGGGGDGDSSAPASAPASGTPTSTPAQTDSGSVSAKFVRGAAPRHAQLSVGTQTFGRLTESEQASSGAMVRLNDTTLSGSAVTQDISGDADFALGRWTAGTVTTKSGAQTLTGNRAHHYVAFNTLDALPTSGSATCDAGVFTTPTSATGAAASTAASAAAASPATTVTFDDSGARVAGEMTVNAGGATAKVSLKATLDTPATTAVLGQFLNAGPGAAVQIGKHGAAGYSIVVGYIAEPKSGERYMGVALLRCK